MGAKYGKHRASGSEKTGSGSSVFRPRIFSKDKDGSGSDKSLGRSRSHENLPAVGKESEHHSPTNSRSDSPIGASRMNHAGSPEESPRASPQPPDTSCSRSQHGSTPNSPKRGPSFSAKGDKQAVLFQKSLSQEGLLNYIRNESMARALQESSGVKPLSEESDAFAENPFLLRNPNVILNSWEIHVSNDEKPPTVSNIKVSTLSGYGMAVLDTAIHPGGTLLATACASGEADLFSMPLKPGPAREKRSLGAMRGRFAVGCVAFSPDGALAATGGHDKALRVWDVAAAAAGAAAEPVAATFMHESAVTCVAFAPHNAAPGRPAVLASGGADKPVIFVWAVEPAAGAAGGGGGAGSMALRELCMLVGHWSWLTCLCFSPDGCSLASSSQDGTVRVWDLEGGEPTASMGFKSSSATVQHRSRLHGAGLRGVGLKEMEEALEADGSENRYVWSAPDGAGGTRTIHLCKVQDLDGWGRFVEARFQYVDCSTGRILYTSSGWLQILRGHTGAVNSVCYSPDGRHIASAGQDGTVRIWSADSAVNREVITDDRFVEGTAGYHVISIEDEMTQADDDASVAHITTDDGDFRYRFRFAQQAVFFDKGDLAADPSSGTGMMHRPKVGFKDRMRSPVYQIIRDSDGKVLFDWNFAKMELRGHRAAVTCLHFVLGGNMVISSGADGTLRLWGLDDGLCRAVLHSAGAPRPAGAVTSLHVVLDPPVLTVADRLGQVHVVEGCALEPVCPHLFDFSAAPR